jgi:hypothetical protein
MWKEGKRIFWLPLGHVAAMVCAGDLFGEDDPQRFVWLGRGAESGASFTFLTGMLDQMCNFNNRDMQMSFSQSVEL